MSVARNRPSVFTGNYLIQGAHRLVVSTGAVTILAARTATAGQLLVFRWSSSTSTRCILRYVGAKFVLTTAYTTAQETGCDMILARSFTVNATSGTAVDVGDTVAKTGTLCTNESQQSKVVSGAVRVATTATVTAGTHTLDANPIGVISDWSGAIGDTVPRSTSGAMSGFGTLWDARDPNASPIVFGQDEGFVVRNLILMGAVGVGRWDFCVEWDEGVPQ